MKDNKKQNKDLQKNKKNTGQKVMLNDEELFALPPEKLKWIGIAVLFVIIGMFLVSGGGSKDPNVFNYDIFSFRRVVIAPLVMFFAYLSIIYIIMKKNKKTDTK